MPTEGETIYTLEGYWHGLIADQEKTLEIRPYKIPAGWHYLATKQTIFMLAKFDEPFEITTREQWAALRPQHLVQPLLAAVHRTRPRASTRQ